MDAHTRLCEKYFLDPVSRANTPGNTVVAYDRGGCFWVETTKLLGTQKKKNTIASRYLYARPFFFSPLLTNIRRAPRATRGVPM